MTTIVTRLYENAAHADAVVAQLKAAGFPEGCMDVVEQRSQTSARDQITAAGVPGDVAQQYAQHLTSSRALLVVRAPFVPFGAAKTAIEAADAHTAFDAGVADENLNIPDEVDRELFLSILPSHRLFLTNSLDVDNSLKKRGLSNAFRIPTISARPKKMRPSVFQRVSIIPMRLLTRRRASKNLLMDRFFAGFIMPHLTAHRRPRNLRHFRITN